MGAWWTLEGAHMRGTGLFHLFHLFHLPVAGSQFCCCWRLLFVAIQGFKDQHTLRGHLQAQTSGEVALCPWSPIRGCSHDCSMSVGSKNKQDYFLESENCWEFLRGLFHFCTSLPIDTILMTLVLVVFRLLALRRCLYWPTTLYRRCCSALFSNTPNTPFVPSLTSLALGIFVVSEISLSFLTLLTPISLGVGAGQRNTACSSPQWEWLGTSTSKSCYCQLQLCHPHIALLDYRISMRQAIRTRLKALSSWNMTSWSTPKRSIQDPKMRRIKKCFRLALFSSNKPSGTDLFLYQHISGVQIASTAAIPTCNDRCSGGAAILVPAGWTISQKITLLKGRAVAALVQDRSCPFFDLCILASWLCQKGTCRDTECMQECRKASA